MPGGMGPHGPRGGAPTEKADDLGGVLKDLMRFSRRYIPAIIVALVLGVVGTVCQIIGPDYLGDMTDEITKGLPAMINGKPVLGPSTWPPSRASAGRSWRCMWRTRCARTCRVG